MKPAPFVFLFLALAGCHVISAARCTGATPDGGCIDHYVCDVSFCPGSEEGIDVGEDSACGDPAPPVNTCK